MKKIREIITTQEFTWKLPKTGEKPPDPEKKIHYVKNYYNHTIFLLTPNDTHKAFPLVKL